MYAIIINQWIYHVLTLHIRVKVKVIIYYIHLFFVLGFKLLKYIISYILYTMSTMRVITNKCNIYNLNETIFLITRVISIYYDFFSNNILIRILIFTINIKFVLHISVKNYLIL